MNEQTKSKLHKLADQCKHPDNYHQGPWMDYIQFAELIVQECMQMCDNVSADYLKHRKAADDFQDKNIYAEGEAACDIIKYQMKKHFGVEE